MRVTPGVAYPGGSVDARASSSAQPGRAMVGTRVNPLSRGSATFVSPSVGAHLRVAPLRYRGGDTGAQGAGTTEERQFMSTQGTVKWFNSEKGFGFIAPDEGGADVFAHYTAIEAGGYRSLEENQRVEFEIAQGPKGLQAENIRPV